MESCLAHVLVSLRLQGRENVGEFDGNHLVAEVGSGLDDVLINMVGVPAVASNIVMSADQRRKHSV